MHSPNRDPRNGEFDSEMLLLAETNTDELITAQISFDPDDIDAAFEELDARYLAGEAGAHSRTWSAIAQQCVAFNRHELPATDWVTIDHRQLAGVDATDLQATTRGIWDATPDFSIHIEAVQRLSSFGAFVTYAADGTSQQGLGAGYRGVSLMTVEDDMINRTEIFDEADLDAALARFDELSSQTPRLENAASRVHRRLESYFAARDWGAIAETAADNIFIDDRRRVVGAGRRQGRDAVIAEISALTEIGDRKSVV